MGIVGLASFYSVLHEVWVLYTNKLYQGGSFGNFFIEAVHRLYPHADGHVPIGIFSIRNFAR